MADTGMLCEIHQKLGAISSDVNNIKEGIVKINKSLDDSKQKHETLLSEFRNLQGEHVTCFKKREKLDKMIYDLHHLRNTDQAVTLSWKQRITFFAAVLPGFGAFLVQMYYTFFPKK